ncbi:MAG: mucoidy inhibitor MuiA family protein [Bacteroidales bacterium]
MKTTAIAMIIIFISCLLPAQDYIDTESRITAVTVFPDRAQIEREASLNIPQGKSLLRIPGLSPYADASSLQVKGEGNFMILSVNSRQNYLENTEENEAVRNIRERIDELKTKIEDEKTGIEILKEKEAFLTANRVIGGKNEKITAQELADLTEVYTSSIEEVRKGILSRSRLIKDYDEEKQKLENQLQGALRLSRMPTSEAIISVSADQPARAVLTLSYLAGNAGWYPSYDIRISDIEEDVNIIYKANVWQNTGIDWKQTIMSFSDANPSETGTLPVLHPSYLDFYSVMIRGSGKSTPAMARSKAMDVVEDAIAFEYEADLEEASIPPVSIITNSKGFSFEVNIPQTVNSDGKNVVTELQHLSAEADYKYITIPKLREEAYLTADIPEWESLNLLDGEANIYFGNTFTGTSIINTADIADTLNISLGTDNGINAERESLKEYTSTRLIGTNKIETRSYRIRIRNNKTAAVDIDVYDQVPVSQNKDIEVEATELSGGIMNEFTGEVRWQTGIPAGESKEFILTYTVKYPKNKKVIIE